MIKLTEDITLLNFHVLLTAPSGCGKSRLTVLKMLDLAKELSNYKQSFDITRCIRVIDPKGANLYSLRGSIKNGDDVFASSPHEALQLLRDFYDDIQERGKLLDSPTIGLDDTLSSLGYPPCWLFFDEFVDLIEQAKLVDTKIYKEIVSLLIRIITKGRALNCFIWITAMRADTSYLPGLIRSTMTNITLATEGLTPDPENLRMMFGTATIQRPPLGTRYYGYAKAEAGSPQLFLTPTYSDKVNPRSVLERYLAI